MAMNGIRLSPHALMAANALVVADTFNLKEGDSLVVLGDDAEGIALVKSVDFENKIQEVMRLSQQKAEEKE